MNFRIDLKDHLRETQIFNNRALICAVLCAVFIMVIIVRMVYLQIFFYEHYTTLSKNNRLHIVPVAPARGVIYDRNGVILAQHSPTFILTVVPERVEDMDATVAKLRALIEISDNDVLRLEKLLKGRRPYQSVPLRFRLNDDEVARFAVNRHRFPGVDIEARLTRQYPLGDLVTHVVGYVGRINESEQEQVDSSNYKGTDHIGKTGVEKRYENILHGFVGHQEVETNAQGRVLRVLSENISIPGQNLHLNIDAALQSIAMDAFGDHNGSIVAIEPKTGAIRAMVSMPSFDPNPFVNGIDPKSYADLVKSPDRPMYNRSIKGQYPPGSTIKPFMALAGLEYGLAGSELHTFCPGWFRLRGKGRKYRDWKKKGHGIVDLDKAIVQSCDVYFYELAVKLGIDRMSGFLKRLGFGHKTGIDIPGELSGLMPSSAWKRSNRKEPWYLGETVITGIGQGYVLVTPLQLAWLTTVIANRGLVRQPRVVYGVQDPVSREMEILESIPLPPVQLVDPENWHMVQESMTRVVHSWRGTAHRIGTSATYKIAGKTGTAQVFGLKQNETYDAKKIPKKLHDHALFIAYAPVEDPQIAVAVIVEHGGHGGSTAAPIARKVMDAYLVKEPRTTNHEHGITEQ